MFTPAAVATQVSAVVGPDGAVGDIDALAAALNSEAGVTATVDRGVDLRVSIDLVADAGAGTEASDSFVVGSAGTNYTLLVDGVETAPLALAATNAQIEAALEALPNVDAVTVTGTTTRTIVTNIPVGPHVYQRDIDAGGAAGITEVAAGVAPAAVATVDDTIVAALAAVSGLAIQAGYALESVRVPVLALTGDISAGAVALTEDESAQVNVATTLTGATDAFLSCVLVDTGVAAALPAFIEFEDLRGDLNRGSRHYKGQGILRVLPEGEDVDGVYQLVISVVDSNGGVDHEVVTVTVSDPA